MSSTRYRPRFGYDIRINGERKPPRPVKAAKRCAKPGCLQPAEVNVPKSRDNLDDRQWLCRDQLRQHNAQWDFFAGMSDTEIEHFCLDSITGHRPTWPLGKRSAGVRDGKPEPPRANYSTYQFADGFSVFEDTAEPQERPRKSRLTKGQLDALAILNLEDNATLHEIKARYKELVKRFHPDANGGNRSTEERLRQVITAYGHLRATGLV